MFHIARSDKPRVNRILYNHGLKPVWRADALVVGYRRADTVYDLLCDKGVLFTRTTRYEK